jgi:hypothetical protein
MTLSRPSRPHRDCTGRTSYRNNWYLPRRPPTKV